MPVQWWSFDCGCGDPERPRSKCPTCGAPGTHLEWRLTAMERSDLFRWGTGVPLGDPHAPSEEVRAIQARLVKCSLCEGHGLIQPDLVPGSCALCPCCHGLGGAVDGQFDHRVPGADIAMNGMQRLWDKHYKQDPNLRSAERRARGQLAEHELDELLAWLRKRGFHDEKALIPAIRDRASGRVAVGSTYAEIIESLRLSTEPSHGAPRVSCGFIDLELGRFLNPQDALAQARERHLKMPPRVLHPEWLPYHRTVPCGIIPWRIEP